MAMAVFVIGSKIWRLVALAIVVSMVVSTAVAETGGGSAGGGGNDAGTSDNNYLIPILHLICKDDVNRLCSLLLKRTTTNLTNCQVTDCISRHQWKERESFSKKASDVSKGCESAVSLFKRQRGMELGLDERLWALCADESSIIVMPQFATFDLLKVPVGAQSLNLSGPCKEEVFQRKRDSAYDYRIDNKLAGQCEKHVKKLCKRVRPIEGRVQECLRNHTDNRTISYKCNAELFRQERENMDDWRLNMPLWRACFGDRQKFCIDVEDGNGRVLDCLEDHRYSLSTQCFEDFEKFMLRRATDYRFDYHVTTGCGEDLDKICKPSGRDLKDELSPDAKIIQCLLDHMGKLKQDSCQKAVEKVTERAAEDLRFDRRTYDYCYDDLKEYCDLNKTGQAELFHCLEKNRAYLDDDCEDALFKQELRFARSIHFKYRMKISCVDELKQFCSTETTDKQIHCLYSKIMESPADITVRAECAEAVRHDLEMVAEGYCYNYPLRRECNGDISRLCASESKSRSRSFTARRCHKSVLKCLQEKADQIKGKECRKELAFHEQILGFADSLIV